jgi:hypothetical protein
MDHKVLTVCQAGICRSKVTIDICVTKMLTEKYLKFKYNPHIGVLLTLKKLLTQLIEKTYGLKSMKGNS